MADSGTLYLRAAAMMIMTMTDGYYHDGWAGNRLCLRSIRLQLPCRACLCALHCVGWVDGFSLRGNRRQLSVLYSSTNMANWLFDTTSPSTLTSISTRW